MDRCLGNFAMVPRTPLVIIICVVSGLLQVCPCGGPSIYADVVHGQTTVALLATQATAYTPRDLSDLQALEQKIQAAVEKTLEATVSVQVMRGRFGRGSGFALGSGVVVSEDGYVMTAAHVSSRPNQHVKFRFANGHTASGVTLGFNQNLDMGFRQRERPRFYVLGYGAFRDAHGA